MVFEYLFRYSIKSSPVLNILNIETPRLSLSGLDYTHAAFICELVNSDGWLRFIGNRNVYTTSDALQYIEKINSDVQVTYWVVTSRDTGEAAGIVTYIKRDELELPDVGFAFLPRYEGKGLACEAVKSILDAVIFKDEAAQVLATVLPQNEKSVKLIKKLGFVFQQELIRPEGVVQVFRLTADLFHLHTLTTNFYNLFSNKNNPVVGLPNIYKLCIETCVIIKADAPDVRVYNLQSFIEPRQELLSKGLLTDFTEEELMHETHVFGLLAQRHSVYHKAGILNGEIYKGRGHKMFQYIKTGGRWQIQAMSWMDEA